MRILISIFLILLMANSAYCAEMDESVSSYKRIHKATISTILLEESYLFYENECAKKDPAFLPILDRWKERNAQLITDLATAKIIAESSLINALGENGASQYLEQAKSEIKMLREIIKKSAKDDKAVLNCVDELKKMDEGYVDLERNSPGITEAIKNYLKENR